MKKYILIFLAFIATGIFLSHTPVSADIVPIPSVAETTIEKVSINAKTGGNLSDMLHNTGLQLLRIAKLIIGGFIVIFLVYTGIQMIYSMGGDEETLGKAKRQLWYTFIALAFINMPETVYLAFNQGASGINATRRPSNGDFGDFDQNSNILFEWHIFENAFFNDILGFIEMGIFGVAILMIIISGIKILSSRGRDEKLKEGRIKIIWTIIALISVGFIESWKWLSFQGKLSDAVNIFDTLFNIGLYLAGPIAIIFLTLAGYYYITSNGDEEKVKKAKSIIINTALATLILLASYTFLNDLLSL